MPKLLMQSDSAQVKEVPLVKDCLTIGRKADNDLVIADPAVSGHHCRISRQDGDYIIEDLGSTNGTFVNNAPIDKAELHHNDIIVVAKHTIVFDMRAPSAAALAAAAAPAPAAPAPETVSARSPGWLRVLKGAVGPNEYELKNSSTYIGKSDRVQIPIKGAGLFGSAPEVAASIHRKPEGFVLVAVTDGYPVVNGAKVSGSVLLKEGDLIECGATTMRFELRETA